jgi:hypothetical protein
MRAMTNRAKAAFFFPAAYDGKVVYNGKEMSIIEVATLNEEPPILCRHGDWAVTPEGITCLTHQYFISLDRLDEDDWERHMEEKN